MSRVRVGESAPDFELDGTGRRTYRLADYRGIGVILAFYPHDFTPVCTRQFCSYRDDGDRIESLGVPMLGISPQSVESHERFAAHHGLTVPLASDPDKRVAVLRRRAGRVHPARGVPGGRGVRRPLPPCRPVRSSLPGRRHLERAVAAVE